MISFFKRSFSFVKFILLAITITAITLALVTFAQGYTFNTDTLKFEAGGLLILGSRPNRADIYVDGEAKNTTPNRLLLADGRYDVEMHRSGYRRWQKEITIRENEVVWAQYPFFVPNNVTTEAKLLLDSPRILEQSPDKQYLAIAEAGDDPRVFLYDSRLGESSSGYRLIPGIHSVVESLAWSSDSNLLLVEIAAQEKDTSLWHIIDTSGSGVANGINPRADLVAKEAEFSSGGDLVYFTDKNNVLSRLDINSGESVKLMEEVGAFTHRGGEVFAIKHQGRARSMVRLRNEQEVPIKKLPSGREYRLMYTHYDDEPRLVLQDMELRQVTLIETEGSDASTETLPPLSAREVTISPKYRYVTMYDGPRFLTYDMERSEYHTFTYVGPLTAPPTWFDEHHLLLTGENTVKLVEFDGKNREELVPIEPGLPSFGVNKERLLFSVGRSSVDDGLWLQVSNLK